MPGLQPHQAQEIRDLIHARQILRAIKVYREATGASLAEARRAVEEMALTEVQNPHATNYDNENPVLEAKIQSLLAKGKKIEAVNIYRAENRVDLGKAQDAVDRIQAAMPRDPVANLPYDPVIGSDPFVEEDGGGRRVVLLLAAVVAVAVCGLAILALFFGI